MSSQPSDVSGYLLERVREGFKGGDDYHRYRPTYTDDLANKVLQELDLQSRTDQVKTILELAAGTGKFTEKVLPKLASNECLIASEPVPEFLHTLKQNCPDAKVLNCAAEQIPLENESVHGIVAAQSFHWFYNKQALDEMYRVLVPGCSVVLLWNFNDRKIDWIDQVKRRIDASPNDPHQYFSMAWKTVIDSYSGFRMNNHQVIKGVILEGDVEFILKHCSTHSEIKRSEGAKREEKLEDIRQVLLTHEDTKGRKTIQLPFYTDIYSYRKV